MAPGVAAAPPPASRLDRMPVEPPGANGLLPGRGPACRWPPEPGRAVSGRPPPARRPIPVLSPPNGLLPGRGPSDRGRASGLGSAGPGLTAGVGVGAGSCASAGAEAAAATAASATVCAAAFLAASAAPESGSVTCAGFAARFAGALSAAVLAAAFFGPALAGSAAKDSLSRRTTGASTVDEADRTNSPKSPSLASTTLLSTPNSLASSYTRTFATALLLGPGSQARTG